MISFKDPELYAYARFLVHQDLDRPWSVILNLVQVDLNLQFANCYWQPGEISSVINRGSQRWGSDLNKLRGLRVRWCPDVGMWSDNPNYVTRHQGAVVAGHMGTTCSACGWRADGFLLRTLERLCTLERLR